MPSSVDKSQTGSNVSLDGIKKRIQAEKFLDTILNFKPLASSKQSFTRFFDLFVVSIDGLKSLQLDNLGEFILYSIAMRKLDFKTRGDFEAIVIYEKLNPTIDDLVKYIEGQRNYNQIVTECLQENKLMKSVNNHKESVDSVPSALNGKKGNTNETLEKSETGKQSTNLKVSNDKSHNRRAKKNSKASPSRKSNAQSNSSPTNNHTLPNQNPSHSNKESASPSVIKDNKVCFVCGIEPHPLNSCTMFNNSDPDICLNYIKTKKLCANCFGSDHLALKCPDKSNCNSCRGKHHYKLHLQHYCNVIPKNSRVSADKSEEKTNDWNKSPPSVTSSSDDSGKKSDVISDKPTASILSPDKAKSPDSSR